MTPEIIASLIFIFSFLGISWIVFPKLPSLDTLPEKKESEISKIKRKLREINPLKNFQREIFLEKIISRVRIFALKVDNLTFRWLRELRAKQKEKFDSYWDEIKKAKKQKPV